MNTVSCDCRMNACIDNVHTNTHAHEAGTIVFVCMCLSAFAEILTTSNQKRTHTSTFAYACIHIRHQHQHHTTCVILDEVTSNIQPDIGCIFGWSDVCSQRNLHHPWMDFIFYQIYIYPKIEHANDERTPVFRTWPFSMLSINMRLFFDLFVHFFFVLNFSVLVRFAQRLRVCVYVCACMLYVFLYMFLRCSYIFISSRWHDTSIYNFIL